MRISTSMIVLPLAIVLAETGCSTSGRYVALKEFSSPRSSGENSAVKGHTVCIKPFASAFNLEDKRPSDREMQPKRYAYVKMTKEEKKMWEDEIDQRKKTGTEADWIQIGYVRNRYRMKMSKVYALNDPGAWLADTLKADLQKLGACVVDTSQEADAEISVGGTIKYLSVDNYGMNLLAAFLKVDVQLKPRTQAVTARSVYTAGTQTAWSSSSGSTSENYQPLRECQQKFSRLVIADMERLLKE
jgi:hypothetical protein